MGVPGATDKIDETGGVSFEHVFETVRGGG